MNLDLFQPNQALSVSELNHLVAQTLTHTFPLLSICGEISNFTRANSGHWYFNLKDESSQVRAVMFRPKNIGLGFSPRNGDKVQVRALVTLYEARGEFQLNIESIKKAGQGDLHEAFLVLKNKLEKEGLFKPERKKELPVFPKTIGVITSTKTAALRDVLTTFERRTPHINIIIYPTSVQGKGSEKEIAEAIKTADNHAKCDVLIICRGGGSIEDLWAFNEEIVARAISESSIPVISGIGHETDFTITDFVADLRAPTPTAAAEQAATAREDWIDTLREISQRLTREMKRCLENNNLNLDHLSTKLVAPSVKLMQNRSELSNLFLRMKNGQNQIYAKKLSELNENKNALELLNPQQILERGYAIVSDASGKIIRKADELNEKENITLTLSKGKASLDVANLRVEE